MVELQNKMLKITIIEFKNIQHLKKNNENKYDKLCYFVTKTKKPILL